jgi:hypothetical protein
LNLAQQDFLNKSVSTTTLPTRSQPNFIHLIAGSQMSADLKNYNPQGNVELNINDASEIRHWIQHWNVTEAELRKTVAEVGTDVDAVRTALGK